MAESASELLRRFDDAVDGGRDADASGVADEILAAIETDPDLRRDLALRRDDLVRRLEDTNMSLAESAAKLAVFQFALATPVQPDYAGAPARLAAGPAGERLVAGLLLAEQAHERVPVDEATVARSLDPLRAPDFDDPREVYAGAVGLLKTAAYYVLDARDSFDALASEPPEQDAFPPLPFPRVWIETREPGRDRPAPYLQLLDEKSEDREERWRLMDVLGVGLVEVDRSHVWDIYIAFRFAADTELPPAWLARRISPHGIVHEGVEHVASEGSPFGGVRKLAIGGAHLIVARNVPHDPLAIPRHQRKRIAPALGGAIPSIYYVNLAASGEHDDDHPSGREYHVRWLVRGHWRHLETAAALCTCCQPRRAARWIEPYVKGPAGAPWKGRPVHVAPREEAADA